MNKDKFYNPFEMLNKVVIDDDKKICPNCKSRNEKISQFCAHCGFNFIEKVQKNIDKADISTTQLRNDKDSQDSINLGAYLVFKNNIIEYINKSPFIIGKDKNNTDLYLDSKVVSRIHAKIVIEGSNYFLVDNNSTNGTFINGMRIQSNVKHLLKANDKIRLANVDMSFIYN